MTSNPVEQVNSVPGKRTVKFDEACHARYGYGPSSLLKTLTHFMHKLMHRNKMATRVLPEDMKRQGTTSSLHTLTKKAEENFQKSVNCMEKNTGVLAINRQSDETKKKVNCQSNSNNNNNNNKRSIFNATIYMK